MQIICSLAIVLLVKFAQAIFAHFMNYLRSKTFVKLLIVTLYIHRVTSVKYVCLSEFYVSHMIFACNTIKACW